MLLAAGHRRIGFINTTTPSPAHDGRLEGCRQALADAGVPFDPALVVDARPEQEGGFDAVGPLLSQEVTGVFCHNDRVAMGVYDGVRERGRRGPIAWPTAAPGRSPPADWICPRTRPSAPPPPRPRTADDLPPGEADLIVDGTGLLCVTLLLRLRKPIGGAPPGTVVHVIATDPAAPPDLPAWCHMTGHTCLGPPPRRAAGVRPPARRRRPPHPPRRAMALAQGLMSDYPYTRPTVAREQAGHAAAAGHTIRRGAIWRGDRWWVRLSLCSVRR